MKNYLNSSSYYLLMVKKRLVEYIQRYRPKYSKEKIYNRLIKDGWNKKEIESAMKSVEGMKTQKKSSPDSRKKHPKKEEDKKERKVSNSSKKEKRVSGIKKRNVAAVIIFSIVTFGIFYVIWMALTTKELRKNTQSAPNPNWLFVLLLPIISLLIGFFLVGSVERLEQMESGIWIGIGIAIINLVVGIIMFVYYWKYSEAINELSGFSSAGLFLLFIFLFPVAQGIAQSKLNKVSKINPKDS